MLLRVLAQLYGRQYALGGLAKIGWSGFVIIGAFYFVRSLLLFVDTADLDNPYTSSWTGWTLAAFFFLAAILWGTLCASLRAPQLRNSSCGHDWRTPNADCSVRPMLNSMYGADVRIRSPFAYAGVKSSESDASS
jgi:hypothetical protein